MKQDVYGMCVHGENLASCWNCRETLESGVFDYFWTIYRRSSDNNKDLFTKKNIKDMSLDSAERMIDIIESADHLRGWETNLINRIKDIHAII